MIFGYLHLLVGGRYTRITVYFSLSNKLKVDKKPNEIRVMTTFFRFVFMLILIHIFFICILPIDFQTAT